jgi:hypothetical protein
MSLQRLTLDHMSCFATCFPLLDTTEYPQVPLAPYGLVGIAIPVPLIQQDKLTRASQIVSRPFRTRHMVAYVVLGCLLLRFSP